MRQARGTEVDRLGVINLLGNNLFDKYPPESILKELLQNADDADAKRVIIGWTPGPTEKPKHQLLQGPALFAANDGKLTQRDAEAICKFGQNYKFGEKSVIGKFGLGLKSVFHLCEAFFYLSSTEPGDDPEGLFNNLASPWVGTAYDRGWGTVAEEDIDLLRSFLRPVWEQLGTNWFVLWLPLRRSEYCDKVRFVGRYDGDSQECPAEISQAVKNGNVAQTLPLLHSIQQFDFFEKWMPGETQPTERVRLETVAARSRFRDCVQTNTNECGAPVVGRCEVSSRGQVAKLSYALAQSWSQDLLNLTEDPKWPKSFVLGSGQQPDKAQPHGAVLLGRWINRNSESLEVTTAVFLPLTKSTSSERGKDEFFLTVHGCFFIDSGRREIFLEGDDVKTEWNRRLMEDGTLPLIIPALEVFSRENDDETLTRLTRKLQEWASKENHLNAICAKSAWLYRWYPDGPRWERIDNLLDFLEIPSFSSDPGLPSRAMPGLSKISHQLVLVPKGQPRLTCAEPKRWQDEIVGKVLTIENPNALYENGGKALEYYEKFVASIKELGKTSCEALRKTLWNVFSQIATEALRGPENSRRDLTQKLVRRVPASSRLALPLEATWPDNVRQEICHLIERILIVPDEFEPSDSPGSGVLTSDEAIELLKKLEPYTTPTRNPSLAVIRAAKGSEGRVLSGTKHLKLWKADRVTAEGVDSQVVSLDFLTSDRAVFVGKPTELVRLLASVLAAGEVWVISNEVADIFSPAVSGKVFLSSLKSDVDGVLDCLAKRPALAKTGPKFVELFQKLRAKPAKDVDVSKWRAALRHLFHSKARPDELLLIGDQHQGVWAKLASAAQKAKGTPDRVIPVSELTRALDPSLMDDLGIDLLGPEGVAQLLSEVNLAHLEIILTTDEREEVLRSLQKYPALIQGLPLHDRADGKGMTRITKNCYWEGNGKPGTLAKYIQLLRKCDDEVLAAIQHKAHPYDLTPFEIVRLAINYGPAEHCETILTAFQSSGNLPSDLRDNLKEREWLPLATGGMIAPKNVLYDSELSDCIDKALDSITPLTKDCVSASELSQAVREHEGFRELARQLFPDRRDVLSRLATLLSRESTYCIGIESPHSLPLEKWIGAFRSAPDDVMPAAHMIQRIYEVDSDACLQVFLPPLCEFRISDDRLVNIFAFLRDRHTQTNEPHDQFLDIHNHYLTQAVKCLGREKMTSLLRKISLLNQAGKWSDPETLCYIKEIRHDLNPANVLDPIQAEILKNLIPAQSPKPMSGSAQAECQESQTSFSEKDLENSVKLLREYFNEWRSNEELAGWAGAFLSLLGDYEPLRTLANEFLDLASPGKSVDYVRKKANLQDTELCNEEIDTDKSWKGLMARTRVIVRVTELGKPTTMLNLFGEPISVILTDEKPRNLCVGFGLEKIEDKYIDLKIKEDSVQGTPLLFRLLHLRRIDIDSLRREQLRDLINDTGKKVLQVYYGQSASTIRFDTVLDEFSGDDIFGIRIAQESFLDDARFTLRFLGLNCTSNEHLIELLQLYERVAARKAEEAALMDDQNRNNSKLDGASLRDPTSSELEAGARTKLRKMIREDDEVQKVILEAVMRKVRDYQYDLRSVLFEFFQNADDAYVESGCKPGNNAKFIVSERKHTLTIIHAGRPVNRGSCTVESGINIFHHDLRKMLSFGFSDKGYGTSTNELTGRFGLGFKTAYLISDVPRIMSGRVKCKVVGGIYPLEIPLDDPCLKEMPGETQEYRALLFPNTTPTFFILQARESVDLRQVLEPFAELCRYLVVFARRIRYVSFHPDEASQRISVTWTEKKVDFLPEMKIVLGSLEVQSTRALEVQQAIVIRCGHRGDILFGWDGRKVMRISDSVPSVWVTAPTMEYQETGYLVNAQLDLNIGRSQVSWNSERNRGILLELGKSVGDALIALVDKELEPIGIAEERHEFWQSFWDLVSPRGKREELQNLLMWGQSGAAARLYWQRCALPTGIGAKPYCTLTSLPSIKYYLTGILDAEDHQELLHWVATWESFTLQYHPGSIIAGERVWSRLIAWCPELHAEPVSLVEILNNEILDDSNISPEHAAKLGKVINHNLLSEKNRTFYERELSDLITILYRLTFYSQKGTWEYAAHLLLPPTYDCFCTETNEEHLLSAFAPGDRVLADDYSADGIDFFLTCRGEMHCELSDIADWAISADTREKRRAVLVYLLKGQQSLALQDELHKRGLEGTWLSEIEDEFWFEAGFDERTMLATKIRLGLEDTEPSKRREKQPKDPAAVFRKIAAWWKQNGATLIRQYNRQIYPEGQCPDLSTSEGAGQASYKQTEWLKYFMISILQTLGRVQPDQNRGFLKLCDERGWIKVLTQHPEDGPRNWLNMVLDYIDKELKENGSYFYWLDYFIRFVTVTRHLAAYREAFLSIDRFEGRFAPRDVLSTRASRQFQFGGPDAPTLVPILGIGACFALRELVRWGYVKRADVYPFCYPPVKRLRKFLESLGWKDNRKEAHMVTSRSIYEFIKRHYPQDPTFGGAFDIPLLMWIEKTKGWEID